MFDTTSAFLFSSLKEDMFLFLNVLYLKLQLNVIIK